MRYGIEVLEKEHQNIIKLTDAIQGYCLDVIEKKQINPADVYEIIDMIKNYADKHHHEKEELILFSYMTKELGELADKLITYGMLTEHSLARLAVMDLTDSVVAYEKEASPEIFLDIIGFLMTYRQLLIRHAGKEDEVVYPFAIKALSAEILDQVDQETKEYEEEHAEEREYWTEKIEEWYQKYGRP